MKKTAFFLTALLLARAGLSACTVLYYADDTLAVGGNNADFIWPFAQVAFYPSDGEKYGCAFFGYTIRNGMNFGEEQGGINDQGLFYGNMSTPPNPVLHSGGKPTYHGNLMKKVLEECATVEEALHLMDQYHLGFLMTGQIMIGDAGGDAAVIEGDGIVRKQKDYLISTNFYQSRMTEDNIPCERFRTARRMMDSLGVVSTENMGRILNATHNEGEGATLYSNVYDLKNRIITIYHYFNYNHAVTFDLAEELEKGEHVCRLAGLFPENPDYQTYKAEQLARFAHLEQERADRLTEFQAELLQAGAMPDTSPSPDEILNRYFRAIGGRDRVERIEHLTITGRISVPLGGPLELDGVFKSHCSRGGRLYQYTEIFGFDITEQGVHGDTCWKEGMRSDIRLLDGDEKAHLLLEAAIDPNQPELYAEKTYLGVTEINERPCHKLLLTTKQGLPVAKFFDTETGLLKACMKIIRNKNNGPVKYFTLYDEDREVQGLMFPHRISESSTKQDIFAIRTDYYTLDLTYDVSTPVPDTPYQIPDGLERSSN